MKRILLNIDGVLADFIAGAARLHKPTDPTVTTWNFLEHWGLTASDFWRPMGREFWANLPLTEESYGVLALCEKAVGRKNVCLLTSPCDTEGCLEGKRDWVKRHFPEYSRRCLIGAAKEFCASPSSFLVDDHDKNCEAFQEAGGGTCLFPRPWNRNAPYAANPIPCLRLRLETWTACQKFRNPN